MEHFQAVSQLMPHAYKTTLYGMNTTRNVQLRFKLSNLLVYQMFSFNYRIKCLRCV